MSAGEKNTYEYDELGQLTKDNDTTITYDNYGNILTKGYSTYSYEDYDWNDKLTSSNGSNIAYDESGNIVEMFGDTLVWENGRELSQYGNGNYTINFEYNSDGLRTKKEVSIGWSTTIYKYTWCGDKLTHQTWDDKYFHFYYDSNDEIIGVEYYDGETTEYYTYIKNIQGDVIGIVDSNGNLAGEYSYDAWGNYSYSGEDIAYYNPIRYKGYYCDMEISMYYLQSRYYCYFLGRFINADDVERLGYAETVLMYNVFTYCENNSVMNIDSNGYKWYKTIKGYEKDLVMSGGKVDLKFILDLEKEYHDNDKYIKDSIKKGYGNPNKDYIYNQHNDNVKGLKYGEKEFWYNGCEIAAAYNVMRYLKKAKKIQHVIKQFSLNSLRWWNGKFGTESADLKKFFDGNNIKYNHYTSKNNFETKAKKSKICIMSFWNGVRLFTSIHTVAFYYKKGKWYSYNRRSDSPNDSTQEFKSFEKLLGDKSFIRGYTFN